MGYFKPKITGEVILLLFILFISLRSIHPKGFISQIASIESIQFFSLLNQVFDYQLSFKLEVLPSGYWNIKIQSRNWDFIINKIMPYFNQLYGEKHTGMLKLARIYELLPVKQQEAKVELVTLAYNLTSSGLRTIPLTTKIQAVTSLNISEIEIPSVSVYPFNGTSLNTLWILGFFLGDGNIYIRIRDKNVGLEYIPQLRITQKKYSG